MPSTHSFTIIGAGPVGCLLATMLASAGHQVQVFEKRPDLRQADLAGGRSINLVLTSRGLRALACVDLTDAVLDLTVPVLGRMIHSEEGDQTYQPYGRDDSECNYSVSRTGLNQFLLSAAEQAGATIAFEMPLKGVDLQRQQLDFGTSHDPVSYEILIGCDGAPSAVRKALAAESIVDQELTFMNWGYKELRFPAAADNSYAMDKKALHIWPRGNHFLMGLANLDGSFTGTLYMPKTGENSFETIADAPALRDFFETHYKDALPLLGNFEDTFFDHPVGTLGTVRCAPWHLDGQVLLIGDAAHGIVPFFGQGLNSGFEDCHVFADLLADDCDFEDLFARFFTRRKPNADAIAAMALENAVEMGEKVADPNFLLKKQIEARLEQAFPQHYRSRYALVMYSPNSYAAAYAVGERQKSVLAELARTVDDADDLDLDQARQLIEDRLRPLYDELQLELAF